MNDERIKISELDLTKQTVSLGTEENGPSVSVMEGHVDELTYVKAFHAEGWNNDGTEMSEEQWADEARCEEGELEHTYGKVSEDGMTLNFKMDKNEVGVVPMTIRYW